MSEIKTSDGWTPIVTLDLLTATSYSFKEAEERFNGWAKSQPAEPFTLTTGWQQITPQMAEALLKRNAKNRKANFQTIQAYAVQICHNGWKKTGQPIIFTDEGILLDGQHRLWAAYLCNRSIDTFVVTEVPADAKLFAYIDNVRPRTGGDALYIAGVNGMGSHVVAIVKQLAHRWDMGLLSIRGRVPAVPLSNREILGYVEEHPSLVVAAKLVQGSYKSAVNRLSDPLVATFLGWKIIEMHGEDALDEFMSALITKDLPDGHPVALLQKRLDLHRKAKAGAKDANTRKDVLSTPEILAYSIKAFNFLRTGRQVRRLTLQIDEAFPQLVEPGDQMPEAA
jgi:hypothetical protein